MYHIWIPEFPYDLKHYKLYTIRNQVTHVNSFKALPCKFRSSKKVSGSRSTSSQLESETQTTSRRQGSKWPVFLLESSETERKRSGMVRHCNENLKKNCSLKSNWAKELEKCLTQIFCFRTIRVLNCYISQSFTIPGVRTAQRKSK